MNATAKKAAPKTAKPVTKPVARTASPAAKKVAPAKAPAAKKASAPAPKAPVKPAAPKKPKVEKAPKPVKAVKAEKPRKPKLVRDSFTIPKDEYTALDTLKTRAAKLSKPAKKSEILRAGIVALSSMSDVVFLDVLGRVPAIKTGRPSKD